MATLRETSSCGIRELNGLNGNGYGTRTDGISDNLVRVLQTALQGKGQRAHLWFSDVNSPNRGGRRLCDVILRYGLGPVAESVPARNPSSGNTIVGWVWTPDYAAVASFVKGTLKPISPKPIAAKGTARSKARR